MLIGIHAGLRIESEALRLTWAEVDLKRGDLTVQAAYAKNGETRTIPLNAVLREAFRRLFGRKLHSRRSRLQVLEGSEKWTADSANPLHLYNSMSPC